MGTAVWVGLGVAAWLPVAMVVALCIGRMVRRRDEQVLRPDPPAARPRGPRGSSGPAARTERYLHGHS